MVKQMQAIERTEEPEDVAAVVSFLASEDACFMTGQTIMVGPLYVSTVIAFFASFGNQNTVLKSIGEKYGG